MPPPAVLERGTFEPHLHSRFQLEVAEGAAVELELIEIGALPAHPQSKRPPFSLLFRAAERRAHPQRIYRLRHEALGVVEIFLVPMGPDEVGMRYEAIFN